MTHLYHHKSKIKSTHQKKCEWKRSVWWRCSLKLSTICKWCGWWLMCFYIANVLMENVLQSTTYNAYIFYIENDRWRERTGTIRIMYALFILLFNCNEFKRKYVQSISIIVVLIEFISVIMPCVVVYTYWDRLFVCSRVFAYEYECTIC